MEARFSHLKVSKLHFVSHIYEIQSHNNDIQSYNYEI